jgi:hypothetical protein
MANISTYLTNGKYCFYNSSALKFECTGTMTADTNCSATNSCPNIVYGGNVSWAASAAAAANGNWTLDKTSYFSKTDSYTNLSYAGATYNWVNTNHTYWDLAYSNMNQYYANASIGAGLYANASAYPGVQAALYTNITGINTTSSIQKLLALSNITVTNITLSEAGHTLKTYWNGTMWVEVAT